MTDKPSDISDSIEATEDAQDLDATLAELAHAQGEIDIDISELSIDDLESQVESLLSEIDVPAEAEDENTSNRDNADIEAVTPLLDEAADSLSGPDAPKQAIESMVDDRSLDAAIEDAALAAELSDQSITSSEDSLSEIEIPDDIAQAAESLATSATEKTPEPIETTANTAQAEDLPSLDAQLAEMTDTMLAEPAPDSPPAESDFAASVAEASSDTPPPPGHTESPEPPQPVAPEPEPKSRISIGAHVQRVAYTLLNPLSKPLEKASPEVRHTVGWVGVVTLFMGAVMWAVVLTRAPKEAGAAAPFDLANASLPAVHAGGSTPLPNAHGDSNSHGAPNAHGETPKKDASHGAAKTTSHSTKKSKAPAKKKEAAGGH